MAATAWLPRRLIPQEGKSAKKVRVSMPNGAPTTMLNTLAADYASAHAYMTAIGADGIGLILGASQPNGDKIGGHDLDDCRNPETGEIADWAQRVIALLGSYTEISQSGRGIKIYATIAAADIEVVEAAILKSKGGKGSPHARTWKWQSDKDHGPAIEFYTAKRFFDYTGRHLLGTPAEFRRIDLATILHLINVTGPRFLASDPSKHAPSLPLPPPPLPGPYTPLPSAANDDQIAVPPAVAPSWPRNELWARIERSAALSYEVARLLRGEFAHLDDRSRSNIAMALGGALKRSGFEKDEIEDAIRTFSLTDGWALEKDAEQGQQWIDRIWDNAGERKTVDPGQAFKSVNTAGFENPGTAESGLNRAQRRAARGMVRRARRDLANMPSFAWLYLGLIPALGIVFVAGAPKSLKTFIVLLLAISAAAGAPFAGLPSTTGPVPVAIWIGEGLGNLHARISAVETHYGLNVGDRLAILTGPFSAADVIALFKDDPPAILIIDTLARAVAFSGWDENSPHQMGLFIAELDSIREAFGCLIIVVHHLGKDPTKGMRGATSLLGAADAVFTMTKVAPGISQFANTEMKEAEPAQTLVFELKKQGDSAVAVLAPDAAIGPGSSFRGPVGPDEILALNILKAMIAELRRASSGLEAEPPKAASSELHEIPPNVFFRDLAKVAVPRGDWRKAFAHQRGEGAQRTKAQAFRRASNALVDKHLVTITGDWVELAPASAPSRAHGFPSAAGSMDEGGE